MLRRSAIIALFLATSSQAVNLRLYNQLQKEVPAELAGAIAPAAAAAPAAKEEKKDTPVEVQAELASNAAKLGVVAEKATAAALQAAANADPVVTVNTTLNAPRIKPDIIELDPKVNAQNAAIAAAVQAAKDKVAAEPKIKAQTDKYDMLLPVPLAPSQPLNPANTLGKIRVAEDVPLHELGNPDLKSVAGPAETDQIGKSVYDAAMKGCDETPNPRNILSKDLPSFTPGALPPIPWPVADVPKVENKEIVVIHTPIVDKNPTKQDVVNAQAKADKDMEDALTTKTASDPMNDPELAVEKANLKPKTESDATPKELAKAKEVVEKEVKAEVKEAAATVKDLEKGRKAEEAAAAKVQAANKAEDEQKAADAKTAKKAEEKKEAAAVEDKKVEEAKIDAVNAKADAKIEKKAAAVEKEAAKEEAAEGKPAAAKADAKAAVADGAAAVTDAALALSQKK